MFWIFHLHEDFLRDHITELHISLAAAFAAPSVECIQHTVQCQRTQRRQRTECIHPTVVSHSLAYVNTLCSVIFTSVAKARMFTTKTTTNLFFSHLAISSALSAHMFQLQFHCHLSSTAATVAMATVYPITLEHCVRPTCRRTGSLSQSLPSRRPRCLPQQRRMRNAYVPVHGVLSSYIGLHGLCQPSSSHLVSRRLS